MEANSPEGVVVARKASAFKGHNSPDSLTFRNSDEVRFGGIRTYCQSVVKARKSKSRRQGRRGRPIAAGSGFRETRVIGRELGSLKSMVNPRGFGTKNKNLKIGTLPNQPLARALLDNRPKKSATLLFV